MFNANDISMNGTCNTYVRYSAWKSDGALHNVIDYNATQICRYQTLVIDTPINFKTEMS